MKALAADQTQPATGVASVDECKLRCLDDVNCVGFNWVHDGRNRPQKCLMYSRVIGSAVTSNLYDLYVRERCRTRMDITFAPSGMRPSFCSQGGGGGWGHPKIFGWANHQNGDHG